MSLVRYGLTGLCAGAGMVWFGVVAVIFWRLPDTTSYFRNARLALVAGGLCLVCATLVFVYLTYYVAMPRALFVGCVAAGVTLGILAVSLYRWRSTSGK